MARILVVDDEEGIRSLVRNILVREGHEVTTAGDGVEALRVVERQAVDVVITDLIMPEKEGVETIAELRRRFPAIKIIAISVGGMGGAMDYLRLAKALGAAQTLAKPFTREALLKMVETALAPESTE
jgi:CheY-like chemotaxis protein